MKDKLYTMTHRELNVFYYFIIRHQTNKKNLKTPGLVKRKFNL